MGLIFGSFGSLIAWTGRACVGYACAIFLFGWPLGAGGAWQALGTQFGPCSQSVAACADAFDRSAFAPVAAETAVLVDDGIRTAILTATRHEVGSRATAAAADALDHGAARLRDASLTLRASLADRSAGARRDA